MNKNFAFRTFIAAFIAVLGGLAPLAVTGDFTVTATHALVASVMPNTHFAIKLQ